MYEDRFQLNTYWVTAGPVDDKPVYQVVARSGACAWLRRSDGLSRDWPGIVVNMGDDFILWRKADPRE